MAIDSASMTVFTKTTAENSPRLQPNSAMMGFWETPIIDRAPALTNGMANEAAATHHAKEIVGQDCLIGREPLTPGEVACRSVEPSSPRRESAHAAPHDRQGQR